GEYRTLFSEAQRARWDTLKAAVTAVEAARPAALPTALAMADFGATPRETWLLDRGDLHLKKERVELGFLSVLTAGQPPAAYWADAKRQGTRTDTTYQRRALAEWMADPKQGAGALLARVAVNRLWQHHFGEGLVRTVNDFGKQGEAPSHPELLEWLSSELIQGGWKLKPLHRLLVLSSTYRQSAAPGGGAADPRRVDPENRLLWHRAPRRIEAEAFRDAMLSVSGSLNEQRYGPAFKPPIQPEAIQARNVKDPYPANVKDTPETRRRTIYSFHKRVVQYPLLQAFDGPDAAASCGRRNTTTVAPQALAVLNEPFVRLRAQDLAARVRADAGEDAAAQVDRAYRLALGRAPAPKEQAAALRFLEQQAARRKARDAGTDAGLLALTDFAQVLFGLNEFMYVD
ncbi:MAG: Planctomycete cytochrome, partial [Armatimonadetes bacterium]|nr:Planctomycete cytochrome [Armatimonadota bacterium]